MEKNELIHRMSPEHRISLIVGLGNPGAEYENTRHNAGAWLVNQLAVQQQQSLRVENKFYGTVASINSAGHKCYLLIPTTYMNHSGQAVCAIAKFYKIAAENILIAHDEIDLPAGAIRYKFGGGHGGHNGLRDIFKSLGSNEFYRLRIGIGRPKNSADVIDYVLKRPSKSEQQHIDDAIDDALHYIPEIIAGKTQQVMKALHTEK